MLLANYASDSDAESDAESDADTNAPAPSTSRLAAPAPRASAPAGGAAKKKRGPVKITLDRPKPSSSDDPEASREVADEVKDEREAKKPKLAGRLKGGGPGGYVPSLASDRVFELSRTSGRRCWACSHRRKASSRSRLPTERRA